MDAKAKRAPRPASPAATVATEQKASAAPELAATVATEQEVSAAPEPAAPASAEDVADFAREAYEAFAQSQEVMARGFEAFGLEIVGLARTGIDRAAKTASEMLAVRTLSDAIDVNAGFARDSFDTFLEGSTRLSELGIKFAREATQPLLATWQRDWVKAFCPGL